MHTRAFLYLAGAVIVNGSLLACHADEQRPTHPQGILAGALPSRGQEYGVAISQSGVAVVTELYAGTVIPGNTSNFTFGQPITVGRSPLDVAITKSGATAYVANNQDTTVSIVDLATDSVVGSFFVQSPLRTILNQDDTRLYVTNIGSTANSSVVHVFDTRTRALVDTISIGSVANGIAFDSAYQQLFVTTEGDASIYVIDAVTNTVVRRISAGLAPADIAVTPDHREIWLADRATGVHVFNSATLVQIDSIPELSEAFGLAISPDGERVYVAMKNRGWCVIVDRNTRKVLSTLFQGIVPQRIAFNALGTKALVTTQSSGVYFVR